MRLFRQEAPINIRFAALDSRRLSFAEKQHELDIENSVFIVRAFVKLRKLG